MRFRGKQYTGKGLSVAIVDSGVDRADPRVGGGKVEGFNLSMGATSHVLMANDYADLHGHGTDVAAAVRATAPECDLLCIRITDNRLRTTGDLIAAGIEVAVRSGAKVINVSLGTTNMGRALLLRDAVAAAVEMGAVVLAAAHPRGERSYPADLPETVGVAAHQDCPLEKFYYFPPHRFPAKQWGSLTGKFLAHGFTVAGEGKPSAYRGSESACAYLAGRVACLREALPDATAVEIIEVLRQTALMPVPEIGYA